MFAKGDKIHFYGADSKFEGYFIAYISKLPVDYNGGSYTNGPLRCVVQQKDTGILLIKSNPEGNNRGWPSV